MRGQGESSLATKMGEMGLYIHGVRVLYVEQNLGYGRVWDGGEFGIGESLG